MKLFRCKNCHQERKKGDDIVLVNCGCGDSMEYVLDITNDKIIKLNLEETKNDFR